MDAAAEIGHGEIAEGFMEQLRLHDEPHQDFPLRAIVIKRRRRGWLVMKNARQSALARYYLIEIAHAAFFFAGPSGSGRTMTTFTGNPHCGQPIGSYL